MTSQPGCAIWTKIDKAEPENSRVSKKASSFV